ncbi:sulfatase-like hydrolase/transferase [bacterium]|nr:sulfatase-like hydrolase/transferase [bacterium]
MSMPNILVIMTDQQKAMSSHLYGNPFCETPSLERLAKEGVLFERAFTPHPLCMPARVSLWTGQYPHSHGSRRNETPLRAGHPHAFRIWKEMGYRTALIGKNHCFADPEDLDGFDVWCEISHRGFTSGMFHKGMDWVRPRAAINACHEIRCNMDSGCEDQASPRFDYAVSDAPLEDHSTGLITAQTLEFLEQHGDEPFAAWISFPDPHEPYQAPRQYAEMFPPGKIETPKWREGEFAEAPERNQVLYAMMGMEEDSLENIQGVMACYYGMVRFLDDSVGRILDALERLELRENTIVVFCSDHGDFMGEHRMVCKGGVFYDCLTRVPLIVSWPGHVPQGERDKSLVNLVDIVPTLLRLQGVEIPAGMHGEPLPTVTDVSPREATFCEYGAGGPPFRMEDLEAWPRPWGRKALIASLEWREAEGRRKMVRSREWKYVHDAMGDADELYDLVDDPWELKNLATDASYGRIIEKMRLRLLDWSIRTEDARPVPLPEAEMDPDRV